VFLLKPVSISSKIKLKIIPKETTINFKSTFPQYKKNPFLGLKMFNVISGLTQQFYNT